MNKIEFVNFQADELDSIYVFELSDTVQLNSFSSFASNPNYYLKVNKVQNNVLDLGSNYNLKEGNSFYVFTTDTSVFYEIRVSSIEPHVNPNCTKDFYDRVNKVKVNGVEQTIYNSTITVSK
ncbi:MAG: hypothetical protein KA275_04770 [Chitinophagaceae bacterium]|nr:hypothetical protein [Chitinophagaceae bacterium]